MPSVKLHSWQVVLENSIWSLKSPGKMVVIFCTNPDILSDKVKRRTSAITGAYIIHLRFFLGGGGGGGGWGAYFFERRVCQGLLQYFTVSQFLKRTSSNIIKFQVVLEARALKCCQFMLPIIRTSKQIRSLTTPSSPNNTFKPRMHHELTNSFKACSCDTMLLSLYKFTFYRLFKSLKCHVFSHGAKANKMIWKPAK